MFDVLSFHLVCSAFAGYFLLMVGYFSQSSLAIAFLETVLVLVFCFRVFFSSFSSSSLHTLTPLLSLPLISPPPNPSLLTDLPIVKGFSSLSGHCHSRSGHETRSSHSLFLRLKDGGNSPSSNRLSAP
ncbi:hypothetical protein DFJ58DRAFT_503493 [Suillus subalutaceus]|uniref:uncharacterized protein n=1 Tax=Suillus subalutaceus TaxID=48586 RepID=UPI001B86DCFE|nr:uncharacterized protein DFJ58DRAFT_503493 [Suillus subalutaceus]KAG1845892.1 hypothetical protein DFJ58DRAFT_503493 [Suillus subalutaceus]